LLQKDFLFEERVRALDFSDLTRRKLRRKQNVEVLSQPLDGDKPKRKKIAVIVPNSMLTTSSTTTTPRPLLTQNLATEGALNRTEDDPRCNQNI